jgi:hypothetical protein
MAKVRIAIGTADFGPDSRGEGAILNELYGIVGSWGVERWPPASRVKLCFRFEQFIAASFATIASNFICISVFASKGTFGCTFSKYGIRKWIKASL